MYISSGKVHTPQQAALRGDPARGCRLVGQLAPALVPTSPDNRGLFRDFFGNSGDFRRFFANPFPPFPSLPHPRDFRGLGQAQWTHYNRHAAGVSDRQGDLAGGGPYTTSFGKLVTVNGPSRVFKGGIGQLAPALVPTSPDNRGWWPLHYAPLLWDTNTVP